MQNQNPSDNIQPSSQANVPPTPTPGMSPPAPYPSYPPPATPNAPAPYPYPSPSMPNEPIPPQYPSPSMPNGSAPAPYPYPSPYQQPYPPYTPMGSPTNNSVIKPGLIGGAIASGIDILVTLLLTFVPAVENIVSPLYQIVPLLPSFFLSVGTFIVSLIIALLCAPGFFIAGLQAIRQTGKTKSAMLACTLALASFVAIDLILIIATTIYSLITIPPTSPTDSLKIWVGSLLGWLIDLIMMSMLGFAAAALGAAIGKQPRY